MAICYFIKTTPLTLILTLSLRLNVVHSGCCKSLSVSSIRASRGWSTNLETVTPCTINSTFIIYNDSGKCLLIAGVVSQVRSTLLDSQLHKSKPCQFSYEYSFISHFISFRAANQTIPFLPEMAFYYLYISDVSYCKVYYNLSVSWFSVGCHHCKFYFLSLA